MKEFKKRTPLEKQLFTEFALKASLRMIKNLRSVIKSTAKENRELRTKLKEFNTILETKNKKLRSLRNEVYKKRNYGLIP
jgi:predicted RNase H-like nuclease (RuvC/YqgF family)